MTLNAIFCTMRVAACSLLKQFAKDYVKTVCFDFLAKPVSTRLPSAGASVCTTKSSFTVSPVSMNCHACVVDVHAKVSFNIVMAHPARMNHRVMVKSICSTLTPDCNLSA